MGRHSAPRPDPDDAPPAVPPEPGPVAADAPRDRTRAVRPAVVWPTTRPTAAQSAAVPPTAAQPVAATPASAPPETSRTKTTRPAAAPTPPTTPASPPDEESEDAPRVAGAVRTWVERGLMGVLAALTGFGVVLWVGVGRTTAVVVATGLLVLVPVAAWIAASVPGPDDPEN